MNYFSRWVKPPNFKAGRFTFLALLLCGAQPAGAAVISASAAIDWISFKIIPIDTGNDLPTLTWSNQNDSSQASVGSCCGSTFETTPNWSVGTSATESGATSIYSKSAFASTSMNEIKADALINGSAPNQFLGTSSNSQRSGNFTVQGNGLLLFQANYSLAVDVGTAPSASAKSNVSFNLSSFNEGGSGFASQNFNRNIFSGSPPVSETGVLATALFFQDGWSGNFSAIANASVSNTGVSAIPLPAAFWLFSSALAGVAALRRSNIGPLKTA
jgi:hypothetical protein